MPSLTSRQVATLGSRRPKGDRPKSSAGRPAEPAKINSRSAAAPGSSRAGSPEAGPSGESTPGRASGVAAVRGEATDPTALLDVFIPGRVTNPMNGSHRHWSVRAKWAREWRHSATFWTEAAYVRTPVIYTKDGYIFPAGSAGWARTAKRITFTCHVWRRFDDDALPPMCKPLRDGLVDARAVDGDGPKAPHIWLYEQVVDRKRPGVRILVTSR